MSSFVEINRKSRISGHTYDEERALYHLCDTEVEGCVFAGPADGESALKEARDVTVRRCRFSLRYPFWHVERFLVEGCQLDSLTRAPLWYAAKGELRDCEIEGVKCFRECRDVTFRRCRIVSPEFGWRCDDFVLDDCDITSEYFLFGSRRGTVSGLRLGGKYSFQYTEDLVVENCELNTKDAFWHAKNVTVRNCLVKGEYLGWYSEGLTLENCHIVGTQPLCYCRDLRLVNCTMEGTDLSFENSTVEADVRGNILSVKSPISGRIVADSIGEIVLEPIVDGDTTTESRCEICVK